MAVSWLINMFDDERKIQAKDIIWYSVFSASLIFSKPPVVVIIALPLFIPKSYYQSVKVKLVSIIPVVIGLFGAALWMGQSKFFALFGFNSTITRLVNLIKLLSI